MKDNIKGGALTEVTFFILLALYTPRHGYAIMQFIEEKTSGRLSLGAGTLYGAITTMLGKGWIQPCSEGDDRRKEYIITETGREIAERELGRITALVDTAKQIMED